MSDLQDGRSTGDTTSDQQLLFVVSYTSDDRDWAEWVASHLEGLGYPHELHEPPLPAGSDALATVAAMRAEGRNVLVIASDALLHGVSDALDLKALELELLDLNAVEAPPSPLIVVMIEDVALPGEWDDALRAPMFEAPDDYHTSRDLLLRALELAHPHALGRDATADPMARRNPLPAPTVVIDPFPAPAPAPGAFAPTPDDGIEVLGGDTVDEQPAVARPAFPDQTEPDEANPEPAERAELTLVADVAGEAASVASADPGPTADAARSSVEDPDTAETTEITQTTETEALTETDEPAPVDAEAPAVVLSLVSDEPAEATTTEAATTEAATTEVPGTPAPMPSVFERPMPDAETTPAGAASDPPAIEAPAAAADELPSPMERRRSGLMSFSGGVKPWEAAEAGRASVTETESETADQPIAHVSATPVPPIAEPLGAEATVVGTAEAEGSTEGLGVIEIDEATGWPPPPPASPFSGDVDTDIDIDTDVDTDTDTAVGDIAASLGDAHTGATAAPPPPPPPPPMMPAWSSAAAAASAEVVGHAEQADPASEAEPELVGALGSADPSHASALVEPPVIDAHPAVARLPFDAPSSLWSIDGALELLEQGLRSRSGELPHRRAGLFGASEPVNAPSGVLLALTGPSGVGKTTIALAHAHRQLPHLDVVWWLRGDSAAALRADLRALAVAAGVDATRTDNLIAGLRLWLETTEDRWLLVLDGLAAGVHLDGLLPTSGRGHVLITGVEVPVGIDAVAISPPSPAAARQALADRLAGSGAANEPFSDGALDTLADRLAGQPWALGLAAALLARADASPGRLLAQLNRPPAVTALGNATTEGPADAIVVVALDALQRDGLDAVAAVTTSMALAATALQRTHFARLTAPSDPLDDAVPHGNGVSNGDDANGVSNADGVDDHAGDRTDDSAALAAATALALIGTDQVVVVPAVRDTMARIADAAARDAAAARAATLIDSVLVGSPAASLLDLYGPHAAAVLASGAASDACEERLAAALRRWTERLSLGAFSTDTGDETTATASGPIATDPTTGDPTTAEETTGDEVAAPEAIAEEPTAAEATGDETTGDETTGGETTGEETAGDEVTASEATADGTTGDETTREQRSVEDGKGTSEAVTAVAAPDAGPQQALEAKLTELRDASVQAAATGRYSDAVRHLEELVARTQAVFGPDDLHSLSVRSDLANALIAAGSQHRAHQLLARVLEDTERVYGAQHPATLLAKHNLANSHADLGRHGEALTLRSQVLDAREASLGAEHAQTVSARSNLANSLSAVGRAEEAMQLREIVAEIRLRTLGLDNAQTLGALNNLANSYADVGRHTDALGLRQQVLDGRERMLGADHPHTITARNNLANSLAAVGRFDDARTARERTLADSERVLGPDHPHSITARANLAFGVPVPVGANGRGADHPYNPERTIPSGMGSPNSGSPTGASPEVSGVTGGGWAASAAPPEPNGSGHLGTLQPVEVDIPTSLPAGNNPVAGSTPGWPAGPQHDVFNGAGAPIDPPKRKRRFWFFFRR